MNYHRKLWCIGVALALCACSPDSKKATIRTDQPIQLDSIPGSAPFLTTDQEGHVVISWARSVNDSVSEFCYSVSLDEGESFGKAIVIPGSTNLQPHSENLPKIIFKPYGEVIALWGAANPNPNNKYSGKVFYSRSFDNGLSWENSKTLIEDTNSNDQRYYDVAILPDGEIAIIWLDNRKSTEKEGSSLYFARTELKKGFQHEQKLSEGCCQCCRTDLFVDAKGSIHVLYRGIIEDSIRDMLHTVSADGGKTFSPPQLISNDRWVLRGCPHTGPAMAENKYGLHFTWFTGGNKKGSFYTRSTDNGQTFTKNEKISETGSHPQIAAGFEDRLILTWDESFKYNGSFSKKIGIQVRTKEGVEIAKQYITPEEITASYPVIVSTADRSSLIAYTVKKRDKSYINYQRIFLE